jgi:hypothetical protein
MPASTFTHVDDAATIASGSYVIGTDENHSVREFCEAAFSLGLDYRDWVKVDPVLLRPADVESWPPTLATHDRSWLGGILCAGRISSSKW